MAEDVKQYQLEPMEATVVEDAARYQIVSENPDSTAALELPIAAEKRSGAQYGTEAEMERDLIDHLEKQGYERLELTQEADLLHNLRQQVELLNGFEFEDEEWATFSRMHLTNPQHGIVEKTRTVQEDHRKAWRRPDGTPVNVMLIDKEHIHRNTLQVINQYEPAGGAFSNRYDVTILVNGLPLVHIELKRRGGSLKEAFNQINRYQRDSFWAGCGLYEFVQVFVISNGTQTKYYSNTTRDAVSRQQQGRERGKRQTSNSYEFTSYWTDQGNRLIQDLRSFAQTFLSRHTLLSVLTRYCVLTAEDLLLVMRPYQIAATEAILQRIVTSTNQRQWGRREGGGYVWHSTGSGKTLTSFKTARLASRMEGIDKVLFVVDRKDLDYQTMKEYDRFEPGAANSNTSTAVLAHQLGDPECRIIITTIQKLSGFIARTPQHKVYDQHVVLIFDECHRSQFGDMHRAIVKRFRRYHMFGFTGTPIFSANAGSVHNPEFTTTEGAFGDCLHHYTIVDAIRDGNVLPFKVDYISTLRDREDVPDEQVPNIDRERALMAPERIAGVCRYIIDHFAQKTRRDARSYEFRRTVNVEAMATARDRGGVRELRQTTRLTGFNAILAVASIPFAKLYYTELKRQMEDLPPDRRLKIATIYSYAPNEDAAEESPEDTTGLDTPSREFLARCIEDYNALYGTSYDTGAERFQNYYKDLSLRMKNREVDLLIVVNMFLTGFDATTLNTLWVDKDLRMHGLLQAYSRTNRILNSVKTHGNIVCFRNLEQATNDSLRLFGNPKSGGLVLLRPFRDYYEGYDDADGTHHPGWRELVDELLTRFPLGRDLVGEKDKHAFIKLFGLILRALNILLTFDEFEGRTIIDLEGEMLDYRSIYNTLHDEFRPRGSEKVNINDDLVFEMELMKSIEINIDYILFLIGQMKGDPAQDREITLQVMRSVEASPDLRNKKELIEQFVAQHTPDADVSEEWQAYVRRMRCEQLEALIAEEQLKRPETLRFVSQAFCDGEVRETGTDIANILPPMGLFGMAGARREEKKKTVVCKLKEFFARFFDICSDSDLTEGNDAPS